MESRKYLTLTGRTVKLPSGQEGERTKGEPAVTRSFLRVNSVTNAHMQKMKTLQTNLQINTAVPSHTERTFVNQLELDQARNGSNDHHHFMLMV